MGKLPASLFYWGDFVRDPNVRRCTHAEVGVWIKALCLMFESEPKGILSTNGVAWTDDEIALAIGGDFEQTKAIVTALVTKGVASRNEDGAFFCRRMYREEKIRDDTKKRVRAFRERQVSNEECNAVGNAVVRECTETVYETPHPSSLEIKKKLPDREQLEELVYEAYPRKASRADGLKAIRNALDRLVKGNIRQGPMRYHDAHAWLLERVVTYAESPAGSKSGTGEEFRPHPSTWFNKERYFDEASEWLRPNGGTNENSRRYTPAGTRSTPNIAVHDKVVSRLAQANGHSPSGHPAQLPLRSADGRAADDGVLGDPRRSQLR